jgi:hypothetical protein
MSEMTAENLWGDLPDADDRSPAVELLREQAAYLERETRGELRGEVEPFHDRSDKLRYNLNILVPRLGKYRYTLLQIGYRAVENYPLEIVSFVQDGKMVCAKDEAEYQYQLRNVLTSPECKRAIAALRREARPQPA